MLDAGSMWLTRYLSPRFAYLFAGAGFLMATVFGLVIVLTSSTSGGADPSRSEPVARPRVHAAGTEQLDRDATVFGSDQSALARNSGSRSRLMDHFR